MKKKWLFIGGIILIIIVLSLSKHQSSSTPDVSGTDVEVVDVLVVNSTSNLFSIMGHKLSGAIEKVFTLVFSVINKLLEFVFGI